MTQGKNQEWGPSKLHRHRGHESAQELILPWAGGEHTYPKQPPQHEQPHCFAGLRAGNSTESQSHLSCTRLPEGNPASGADWREWGHGGAPDKHWGRCGNPQHELVGKHHPCDAKANPLSSPSFRTSPSRAPT